MKKLVKFGSLVMMAGIVTFSSGCSCALKQDKLNDRSEALKDSDILLLNDESVDFVATYKQTIITSGDYMELNTSEDDTVVNNTYIVSRDVDTKTYYLTTTTSSGKVGEELANLTIEEKIYYENNNIYVVSGINNSVKLTYSSTFNAYKDSKNLLEEGLLKADYYALINETYDNYKSVPFNACASEGNHSEVYSIFDDDKNLSCEANRELFGKEATYEVSYRAGFNVMYYVTIKVNGDNKITYLKLEKKSPNVNDVTELTISYEDVK